MATWVVHRTNKRKATDYTNPFHIIEANDEGEAWEKMFSRGSEGLYGADNQYTDPWVEEVDENGYTEDKKFFFKESEVN